MRSLFSLYNTEEGVLPYRNDLPSNSLQFIPDRSTST